MLPPGHQPPNPPPPPQPDQPDPRSTALPADQADADTRRALRRALHSTATRGDPAAVAGRVEGMVHDLASLLDGSMRQLGNAMRSLERRPANTASASASPAADPLPERQSLLARLTTIQTALRQMSDLVCRAADPAAGRSRFRGDTQLSVAAAADHAIAMLEKLAAINGVSVSLKIDARLEAFTCPAAYTVLLNGIKNAIESLARVSQPGQVRVTAAFLSPESDTGRPRALLTIADDGPGVPHDIARADPFKPRITSKPGGLGIGLALCREAVAEVGGDLALLNNPAPTPGAHLRADLPLSPLPTGHTLGADADDDGPLVGKPVTDPPPPTSAPRTPPGRSDA